MVERVKRLVAKSNVSENVVTQSDLYERLHLLRREILLKKYLIYGIILILFPIAINFILFQGKFPFAYGNGDVWLGFWGNYSGGVLSAIVAYLVANSQIQKQVQIDIEHRKRDRLIAQLPSLVRIRYELEKYIRQLGKVERERELDQGVIDFHIKHSELEGRELNAQKSKYETDLLIKKFSIDSLDEGVYQLIEKIDNDDIHIKLIEILKFYEDFSDAVSFDIAKLSYRNRFSSNNNYEITPEAREQEQLKRDLDEEVAKYYVKKEIFWGRFFEENMIEQFKEVLERVNDEIEIVKQEKAR